MAKYIFAALLFTVPVAAQSLGGAGTLRGTIRDASKKAIPDATVELIHASTGFSAHTKTSAEGQFTISNIPPNAYRLRVSMSGFAVRLVEIAIRSGVPIDLDLDLDVAAQSSSVTVEAGFDAVQNLPASSNTIDRALLTVLPAISPDSGLNDAILFTTAAVAADSNGFFHPLGDHAQVSYILDGQPISDQRNKVFSTSIPANAIQSMEVISGTPAAEYGDKTSLVVNATTRSGLGQKPSGSFLAAYGSFGTIGEEFTLGLGSRHWGNFLAANSERTARFLDTPEFVPIHDVGNTQTFFDRVDYQPGGNDAFHLNLMGARNWMQVPNTYDQLSQDQRQKVLSYNVAPGYQRVIANRTLLSVNGFVRRDDVRYLPSRNPFDDSPVTLSQQRSLTNFGGHAEIANLKRHHNWKAGIQATGTRLAEQFSLALTRASADAALAAFNLTQGGKAYEFRGAAAIHQAALFAQDSLSLGALMLTLGIRFDHYRGLTSGQAYQPRGAFSYLIRATKTSVRGGFSHSMETPINENLVVSSSTGPGGLAGNLLQGAAVQEPIQLGRRNQYDAGIQQSLGKVVLDVSYFRKYTRNAYDFDALFGTPVTFPIGWRQSKLDGVSARINSVEFHGLRVYATVGHANARFFGPENGGIIFNARLAPGAYRQDHDQVFQQNVNVHYQHAGWWTDFTWRYDSGLVVGTVNNLNDALALTADQQSVIGLFCGPETASLSHRITRCDSPDYGAERIHILGPGQENPDHNPPRTKARNIFNVGVGSDNLFRAERMKTIVRLTVVNLANEAALYNFLSPFSGTHWVAPRTFQAQLGWAF
jgi:hypothetical protein